MSDASLQAGGDEGQFLSSTFLGRALAKRFSQFVRTNSKNCIFSGQGGWLRVMNPLMNLSKYQQRHLTLYAYVYVCQHRWCRYACKYVHLYVQRTKCYVIRTQLGLGTLTRFRLSKQTNACSAVCAHSNNEKLTCEQPLLPVGTSGPSVGSGFASSVWKRQSVLPSVGGISSSRCTSSTSQ